MKKKSKRARLSDPSQEKTVNVIASGFQKSPGNRGRPRKKATPTPPQQHGFNHSNPPSPEQSASFNLSMTAVGVTHSHIDSKSKTSGRLPQALCRLCHGKFSPRSLRHAFNKLPKDLAELPDYEDSVPQSPLLFHNDFQRLVGVPLDRDPRLSEFVCKKCYTNFYKCHSVLLRFLQRVNLLPVGKENARDRKNETSPQSLVNLSSTMPPSFTADRKCLHSLVSWAHHHGEACRSCPDLKEVLEGQCWGSVRAVWGCLSGHSHIMDTQRNAGTNSDPGYVAELSCALLGGGKGACEEGDEGDVNTQEEEDQDDEVGGGRSSLSAAANRTHHSGRKDGAAYPEDEFLGREQVPFPPAQLRNMTADGEMSDRDLSIEEDFDEGRKRNASDDELFQPYQDKRPRRVTGPGKRRRGPATREEPKVRGKPGPKPGWKNKFKPQGEELPNIYKCPYQGCTAVYRATDGLKKHIKEQHEENRERPCPYPGCNKIFMIDRYLQRHVKLIHTDERNYICDQCGQTFKQRKHLSVHQMRHSGAKPLQCEVCGFQCRQRASLKYHMTKHKAEADLEFACVLCSKRFEKAHNLNVHMSMVHLLTQGEALRGVPLQQQPTPSQLYSDSHAVTETGEGAHQPEQER
ncbi:zinc finger protein 276 isoform X1 [Gadus morhua]|uniref:Zinc finger protein 276 n=3 Tax=Gadus morhua TaxID=8049 RepID=A0A8C4Z291_GADMO|nr:zinc finger protein 276 isoform X1 [Gadus morhua]